MLLYIYRVYSYLVNKISNIFSNIMTKFLFYIHNVVMKKNLKSNGIPLLYMHITAQFKIGEQFKMNNTVKNNPIGRSRKCMFVVRENAKLTIGNNVGMSGVIIVCQKEIFIKDYVKIGGNVCIYDTDFHSLDAEYRKDGKLDKKNIITKTVTIEENAFIGAHSTILKGVTIGRNSIVGACSVVTKNVPDNQIWAGNPAVKIRALMKKNEKK